MQEVFQLYSNIYNQDELTPQKFRAEVNNLGNLGNMWIMEIMYSFFMLGVESTKSKSNHS